MSQLIQIPTDQNTPWYQFGITLSAVRYTFEMRYNLRMDRWFLNISDSSGAPILMDRPLLINYDILKQFRTYPVPPGPLFVVDTSGQDTQPGLGDFLKNHQLLYIDPTG